MKLNYKNFEIEIFDDPTYTLNSVNNLKDYKMVYTDLVSQFHPACQHSITINENDLEISSAVIIETGGATGIHDNSFIIEDDFLVHGELQIFRITKEGEILWDFGGRDIWVNIEGKPEITFENNLIRLFDFESNEYVLNFDGKEIEFNPKIAKKRDY
ncbi:hypothetical protein GKZ90_0024300 [Flavobacterium sp. MC2016-06]|uniref:hypothetical protein n=1 Tax=Flavobacterium sp. MC2016-06 TaxID=2676308 RepID=UPI0012BA61E8|nr:hypothetical protein [Flavobacterium sp. MC2016-06]MBU3861876.1 hypothetical protein [Flavobacterium sp. MC2016-06]